MQKNSITNKITPCCGLPFSVIYWWVSNLTLNSESDRQFIISKISQNGIISIDGWKVLINSGTLEADSSLTKSEFLAWFDCGKQPKCEQLKILIESFQVGNWQYYSENLEAINEEINKVILRKNDNIGSVANNTIQRVDRFTGEIVLYKKSDVFDANDVDNVLIQIFDLEIYERVFDKVNVKWFGAKGDADVNDVGTNDTNAIKQAIESLTKFITKQKDAKKLNISNNVIYFPLGKFLISETIILEDGLSVIGEGLKNSIIHCINPIKAISNVKGFDVNGNIISSKNNIISEISLNQGGIHLVQSWYSTIKNVYIENLFGVENTGLYVEIPVCLKVDNLLIRGSSGDGVVYRDFAGSGPSTTTFFTNIWIQHCNRGLVIDGNNGGSHEIAATNFINTIIEYNVIGLHIRGKVNMCNFSTIHFEQNGTSADISDNGVVSFSNVWDDTTNGIYLRPSSNSENAVVKFDNVLSPIQIIEGYDGDIYLSGKYVLNGFPQSCRLIFDNVQAVHSNSLTLKPKVGQTAFLTNIGNPVWWDGGTWRNANGFNVFTPKKGTSAERPSSTDDLFRYFNTTTNKWNTFFNGNWYDESGIVV